MNNKLAILCLLLSFSCSFLVAATDRQKSINVPYYFQYDNQYEGLRACNITSIAMVLDHFNVIKKTEGSARTPDYLYQRFGIKQQPEQLADMFNEIANEYDALVRDHLYTQGTIAQLRTHLQRGYPAIVHGWFTESGHILVVTDFDGKNYRVNDPAGKWNLKKFAEGKYDNSVSGQNILYPAAEFEHAINDNGSGDDLWLHLFAPNKHIQTAH